MFLRLIISAGLFMSGIIIYILFGDIGFWISLLGIIIIILSVIDFKPNKNEGE